MTAIAGTIPPMVQRGPYIFEVYVGGSDKQHYTLFPMQIPNGALKFDSNNWTGYVTPKYFDENGNWLSLGPVPPGEWSAIEALVMVGFIKKLSQTPEGLKTIEKLATAYFGTIGKIFEHIYDPGAQSAMSAMLSQYVGVSVLERLGMVSPRISLQTHAWIDHMFAEWIRLNWLGAASQGLQTLVKTVTPLAVT